MFEGKCSPLNKVTYQAQIGRNIFTFKDFHAIAMLFTKMASFVNNELKAEAIQMDSANHLSQCAYTFSWL